MNQEPLFGDEPEPTGRQLRDEAIRRVDEHADPDWKEWALDAVQRVCEEGRDFTTDEVWLELSGTESEVTTHERRAMGAVMQRAAKLGLIEPLNQWRQSVRPECHANPKRVWRPRDPAARPPAGSVGVVPPHRPLAETARSVDG